MRLRRKIIVKIPKNEKKFSQFFVKFEGYRFRCRENSVQKMDEFKPRGEIEKLLSIQRSDSQYKNKK